MQRTTGTCTTITTYNINVNGTITYRLDNDIIVLRKVNLLLRNDECYYKYLIYEK